MNKHTSLVYIAAYILHKNSVKLHILFKYKYNYQIKEILCINTTFYTFYCGLVGGFI